MAEPQKYSPSYAVMDKTSAPSSEEVPGGYGSIQEGTLHKIKKVSATLTVIISGLALFSDGYVKLLPETKAS